MENIKIMVWAVVLLTLASCQPESNTKKETVSDMGTKQIIMVDVRTSEEWIQDGHADCTVNIPLQEIENRQNELKGYDKIILVCRSGHRAGIAKDQLEHAGFKNVENGGDWQGVTCSN